MPKYADWSRDIAYWAGRDKWVNSEYREGRALAAFIIGFAREQQLDPAHLIDLARQLRSHSEYFKAGAVRLLEQWAAWSGLSPAAAAECPEFPTYVGADGREHAEF
jgi:hypothetical protein